MVGYGHMSQKIISTFLVSLLVGLILGYLLFGGGGQQDGPDISGENIIATSTESSSISTTTAGKKKKMITVGGITFETDADNPGGISLGEVPIQSIPKPIPALNSTTVFSIGANVSPEAQKIVREQIAGLVKKLTANPGVIDNWLSLGLYRKMSGEFGLAKEAWEYAKKLQPNDKQAYNNLADLYQFYLKDYPLAEKNWQKTVELDATFIGGYRGLYNFYIQTKQATKAKMAVEDGLQKNPHSLDLLVLLANFYKEQGNPEQAKLYFTKALAEAKVLKENASLIAPIQAELDALK